MSDVLYLNPPTLHSNPAFSQAVVIPAGARTVIVGGQNAVDVNGKVVGTDLATQSKKAIENLEAALAAAGCTLDDIVQFRIYLVVGGDPRDGYGAWMEKAAKRRAPPPIVSAAFVPALASPAFLVEIEAVAVVP